MLPHSHFQVQKYCFIHIPIEDPVRFSVGNPWRVFTRTMFRQLQAAAHRDPTMMVEVDWAGPDEMVSQVGQSVA
eukprot:365784-Chlamydomonas_euryale.AAC.5